MKKFSLLRFYVMSIVLGHLVVRLCQTEEKNHNQYEHWMQNIKKCQPYWSERHNAENKHTYTHSRVMFWFEEGKMARTARNVNVRLMGKIQQPPFKYTILFSETPKSYEKNISSIE